MEDPLVFTFWWVMLLYDNEELCQLGNGLALIQSKKYFCFTTDSVLLSHFCRVKKGDRCVDLGAGQGILSVLLFARAAVECVDAVEIQAELCDILQRNARMNHLENLQVHQCDLRHVELKKDSYDVVISNPPYERELTGEINKENSVATARHELTCSLDDIIKTGLALLRYGGCMYMCLRPSRLCDVIVAARKYGGELKQLRFVHAYIGKKPNLILMQIRKGGKPDLDVLPPLIMYDSPGMESKEMMKIYQGDINER